MLSKLLQRFAAGLASDEEIDQCVAAMVAVAEDHEREDMSDEEIAECELARDESDADVADFFRRHR